MTILYCRKHSRKRVLGKLNKSSQHQVPHCSSSKNGNCEHGPMNLHLFKQVIYFPSCLVHVLHPNLARLLRCYYSTYLMMCGSHLGAAGQMVKSAWLSIRWSRVRFPSGPCAKRAYPSGQRGRTQDAVHHASWVRIPLLSYARTKFDITERFEFVAQLVRATVLSAVGHRFESGRIHNQLASGECVGVTLSNYSPVATYSYNYTKPVTMLLRTPLCEKTYNLIVGRLD